MLTFRETHVFTRQVVEKLSDSEYIELQAALMLQPELGDLIQGTGGLRKLRWTESAKGKGKRGGARIIYYWFGPAALIYMLLMYSKNERVDLTAAEKVKLRKLVAQEFK